MIVLCNWYLCNAQMAWLPWTQKILSHCEAKMRKKCNKVVSCGEKTSRQKSFGRKNGISSCCIYYICVYATARIHKCVQTWPLSCQMWKEENWSKKYIRSQKGANHFEATGFYGVFEKVLKARSNLFHMHTERHRTKALQIDKFQFQFQASISQQMDTNIAHHLCCAVSIYTYDTTTICVRKKVWYAILNIVLL